MAKCKNCVYYINNFLCECNECYTREDFKPCDNYIPKDEKQEEK